MSHIIEQEEIEKKLKILEAEKLENEILDSKSNRKRGWIVTISLIVGILGTTFGVTKTLSDMSLAYRVQAFKERLETSELFLKQILPSIKNNGDSGQSAKKGAYILSLGLANDFPVLSPSIYAVMESNSESGDTDAQKVLSAFKNEGECIK